jgi:hypothetical protein
MLSKKLQTFSKILQAIEKGVVEAPDVSDLEGYSGKKLISSLQKATEIFCDYSNVYLEIGVFRGLTLLSNARQNPDVACFGIDNFSLFDEKGENLGFIEQKKKALTIPNATVINRDFEEALVALPDHISEKKIGVLFVDGPHDYRSQLMCILLAIPYLADECAIFVDDANYPHVRQASVDFLKAYPDFALLAEAYTSKHVANMTEEEKVVPLEGWWDGLNIMVRDKERTIPRRYPKEDHKEFYPATHDIMRHELAGKAFEVLKLAQKLVEDSGEREAVQQLKKLIQDHRQKNPGLYRHQNTYSESLSDFMLYGHF